MKIVSVAYSRYTGLGNKLFPWARAKIFAERHNCTMVQPIWFSPHGGAITRGGINYVHALRKIWLLGNFRRGENELSILKYIFKYRGMPKHNFVWLRDAEMSDVDGHIIFATRGNGVEGHDFSEFSGESEFLLQSLKQITSKSQLKYTEDFAEEEFIGMNIRCGNDFVSKESGCRGFVKTSIAWFRFALREIRRRYGNMPAIIVSDGGQRQLSDLLDEHNVRLLDSKTAIADLLVLTKAKVLLASGNSSFSEWASFLGQMDTFSSIETPFVHGRGLEYGRKGEKILGLL